MYVLLDSIRTAIFALKYPSLLQFEQDARGLGKSAHEPRRENLRRLFGVERAPSDVRLRERLDVVDPRELRAPFKRLFARAQRGGALPDPRLATLNNWYTLTTSCLRFTATVTNRSPMV